MKGKISKIKNTKGELALPITTAEAVYMDDGTTKLSDEIKDVLKYEVFDDESITVEMPSAIEEIEEIKEELSEINESLDNLEGEVNELKEGNIDIDLTNYVTKSELSTKADKTELHSHTNKTVLDGITTSKISEWNNKSTFNGNYNDLTNKPTIPTKTSQLTNDSGFITSIPSEYITETELNNKGYLTQHQDISGKVDKIEGKGLSTNDYTTAEKNKLSGLTNYTHPNTHSASMITEDSTHRFVTDSEKSSWNNKSNLALGTTSTTAFRGDYGNTAYTHSQSAHAPSNAQKNSDITKVEIESKLTGDISTHTHSQYLTSHQSLANYYTKSETYSKAQVDSLVSGYSSVPSYVVSESESVAEKVLGVRNSDSFVMACASDLHTTGSDKSAIGVTHMGMAMNEINKITQLDLVMILGDIILDRFTDAYKSGFKHVKKSIDEVRKAVPYIQMQGNHDELSTDTTEQGRQKYYAYIGANNVGVTTDYSNKFRNYGYKDFDNYKLRVIYLNSADVSSLEISSDVNISYEQFNWFVNIGLDFSKKEDVDNWAFIVCTHHPLNWYGTSMSNLLTLLNGYKGKSSGTITSDGKSITYNFASAQATLISHFHGHLHNFRSETLGTNKVLTITIPNACYDRNNEYGTSSSYSETEHTNYGDVDENGVQRQFNKTSGSSDDTAFNVVVIDRLNSKIHCFNYGAGIDRIIDFEGGVEPSEPDTPSGGYTNIIDTVGYIDNTRISTSTIGTTKTATGYVCTNIFDISTATKPMTLRTKGVNFSDNQSAITLFDDTGKATYAYLISDLVKGLNVNITASLDTSNNLTMVVKEENANMSKIQISGLGNGSNLIVTINQEIT